MIVELALLTITPGREEEFAALFPVAIKIAAKAKGYLAHELRRSVETGNRFALRIEWQTLEDHTLSFRGSAAFAEWRALVQPFFSEPPNVEHFAAVAGAQG